jgi:hypothetical protein
LSEPRDTLVGTLGGRTRAHVDTRGRVCTDAGWELDWWIGADDRWHVPADEVAVRQHTIGAAPVVETSMRVPGGDAVQRVYGVGGPVDVLAIDLENTSGAPFVVALVVRAAAGERLGRVEVHDTHLQIDGRPAVLMPSRPAWWAASSTGDTLDIVRRGDARADAMPSLHCRAAGSEVALLLPLPHRTHLRSALVTDGRDAVAVDSVDVRGVPSPEQAAAGWAAQLERAMRVELPDERLQRAIDLARCQVLLAAEGAARPDPSVVMALEDWGFDAEADAAWRRLGVRGRRRAARRPPSTSWLDLSGEDNPAGLLVDARAVLASDSDDGEVTLLTDWPHSWTGASLDVHDAPTRAGLVSYAVRWHGMWPALLWDCERPGVTLRCPGLDPDWATDARTGEKLLTPVSVS